MPKYVPSPNDESFHRYDAEAAAVRRRTHRLYLLGAAILVGLVLLFFILSPIITNSSGDDRCREANSALAGERGTVVTHSFVFFPPALRCTYRTEDGRTDVKRLSPWPFG
jgi:hypothetical protein